MNNLFTLYVAQESDCPDLPGTKDWTKVGITGLDDDFYNRKRALSQGNPRGLDFIKRWTGDEITIRRMEKEFHAKAKYNFCSRHDITGQTGHAEWWNMTSEQAIQILQEMFDSEGIATEAKNVMFANFFEIED
tara:strand:+ start:917 stop:1315 length:399 start_codon:yes stop_codon:yes gene_type:complete